MALREIKTYCIDERQPDAFALQLIEFDSACIINTPRRINSYNIYWIKEGMGAYNIDFKSYSFNGEVLFFLTPGQILSIESESIKSAYRLSFIQDFYCIETHDKEISCNGILFNNVHETPFVAPSEDDSYHLKTIMQLMVDEFEHPNTGHYDLLQSYLKQFIIRAVRIKKKTFSTTVTDTETDLYRGFNTLIATHFKKFHSVSEYASRLGVSPKSLTKHLQRIGAPKPSELIKNRIILEAKRQLLYSSKTVKQIAFDLGFSDPAYFSRFFTKAVLESPLSFKNKHKNS